MLEMLPYLALQFEYLYNNVFFILLISELPR